MPALIINTSGNQGNVENKFCLDLCSRINSQSKLINMSGEDLINTQLVDFTGYEVIVIVSHANRNGKDDTDLDCGFGWELLDNPTILTQLLEPNNMRFILVYCACDALSPETITSGIQDPNCLGVIASRSPVQDTDIVIVSEVVNIAHRFMVGSEQDTSILNRSIRNLVKLFAGYPDFWFFDVPRVFEEE